MLRKASKYISLFFICGLLLTACTNVNPITPQAPNAALPPSDQPSQVSDQKDYIVTYNYGDTGPVQLSDNNIVLKVGQKLVLQPMTGLTKNTRFTSAGDYFWGDIMEQQSSQQSTNAIFTAVKTGKGKLTIIPNGTDTDRAIDLWATVQ
ncbi:MAG: hypothetical protein LLG02_09870 [Pelosinus sp.]|nr:hypothetical protein [Pelosinus sp.]